jgi:hypothetical protein
VEATPNPCTVILLRGPKDVNRRRNGIVHAQWLRGSDASGLIASVRLTRRVVRQVPTLHHSDCNALNAVADDANNLSAQLHGLTVRTPGVLAGSEVRWRMPVCTRFISPHEV